MRPAKTTMNAVSAISAFNLGKKTEGGTCGHDDYLHWSPCVFGFQLGVVKCSVAVFGGLMRLDCVCSRVVGTMVICMTLQVHPVGRRAAPPRRKRVSLLAWWHHRPGPAAPSTRGSCSVAQKRARARPASRLSNKTSVRPSSSSPPPPPHTHKCARSSFFFFAQDICCQPATAHALICARCERGARHDALAPLNKSMGAGPLNTSPGPPTAKPKSSIDQLDKALAAAAHPVQRTSPSFAAVRTSRARPMHTMTRPQLNTKKIASAISAMVAFGARSTPTPTGRISVTSVDSIEDLFVDGASPTRSIAPGDKGKRSRSKSTTSEAMEVQWCRPPLPPVLPRVYTCARARMCAVHRTHT